MLQKSARLMLASLIVIALCPSVAFADEGDQPPSTGNPLVDLLYMVVGYQDTFAQEVTSSTASLYPNQLSVSELGVEPADLNGGLMVGAGGSIYYFPETKTSEGSDAVFTYQEVYCFNVADGTWKAIDSLPEQVKWCSVAVFDGRIVVCAAALDESQELVFTYDTRVEESTRIWASAATQGVPVGCGIVNRGGLLVVAGGLSGGVPIASVNEYELSSGIEESVGQLAYGVVAPKMVPHERSIYVYSWGSSAEEARTGAGAPRLQLLKNESVSTMVGSLPTSEPVSDPDEYPSTQSINFGGISSNGVDGVTLAGPLAMGNTADTFTMGWDAQAFAAYNLRASDKRLYGAASCVYLGKLFTLGAVHDDDGNASLSFRSTEFADAALIAGNNGVWRKGSTESLQFTCSPDYGRFSHVAELDGNKLILGTDYNAGPGSTVVIMQPEYLLGLSEGTHTITMFFDDQLTQVAATFKVEAPADSIAVGYTKPTALARTSDVVPVAPLVVVALGAIAVFFVARRKIASRR